MNKTVNINLAGLFFHIDEDAYLKLQRYLDAIKRSFTDSQGRSEILADIEARIAELFSERIQHDKQVVSSKQVDDIIAIMGQPEDYLVDDEIFEDEPKPRSERKRNTKKLYRDTDNSYVAGVASGIGHYFNIDAIWIRLLWVLLTIFSGGSFILIYILFWILVPEALTTSEKLTMTGEAVTISNIEKKIKDGFDTVSDAVKNIDFQEQGQKLKDGFNDVTDNVSDAVKHIKSSNATTNLKSKSKGFFDTISDIFMFFFKLLAKFIGVILILSSAAALIGILIAFFTAGFADAFEIPGVDLIDAMNSANVPIWFASFLAFLAIGIPLFFIFYLGLKILVTNLKSIGNVAKFSLLGIWILAIVGLSVIGVRQAAEYAYDTNVIDNETFAINTMNPLEISMQGNEAYGYTNFYREGHGVDILYDDSDNRFIYSNDVRLSIKTTTDSVGRIQVQKFAEGRSHKIAKERANNVIYNYTITNNKIVLDNFLTTAIENKFRDQDVRVILYLPEGTVFKLNRNTKSFLNWRRASNNLVSFSDASHSFQIVNGEAVCLDCEDEDNEDENDDDKSIKVNIDLNNEDGAKLKINEEGVDIKTNTNQLKIDDDGVQLNNQKVKVDINDTDGISIKSSSD